MALDLNAAPPDEEAALPDLNEQVDDDVGVEIPRGQQQLISQDENGEALPDLNEPLDADEIEIAGGQQHMDLVNDADLEEELHEYGVYAGDVNIIFDQEELEDSTDEEHEHANGSAETRSKDLTDAQRQHIYEALLERSVRGKLGKKRYERSC
ncbi:unnamed protein product [Urochloa humidicola]